MRTTSKVMMMGLALYISACTATEKIIEKQGSDANQKSVQVSEDMDSETLALAGEQLMSPWTFMLAQKAFTASLAKDPTNKRAQFYSALLKPFILSKGIATRLRPYLLDNGGIVKLDHDLEIIPASPLKTFLTEGSPDIKEAKDIQKLLIEMREAWNDLRKFLIVNQSMTLTLNMNPMAFQEAISNNYRNSCKVDQDNDKNFTVICDHEHMFEVKVNAADLVGLRQLAASYVLFLSVYTSYSVDGLEKFIEANKAGTMTEQQQHEYLKNQMPLAGKLLANQSLTIIPDLGSDFLAAARWVNQYQSQLCPTLNNSNPWLNPLPERRPGYLFKGDQFCVKDTDKAKADLNVLEIALRGPIDVVLNRKDFTPTSTKVDYFALVKNPIQDIRELAPTSYSSCGKADTLKDKTLGGTFPLGDAETFITQKCR